MTRLTGPRPRRTRLLRNEPPPDDLVLLLRATGGDLEGAFADIARDARDSASIYAVELGEGRREVLHGASVFTLRSGRAVQEALGAFAASPGYLAVSVGALRSAGSVFYQPVPTRITSTSSSWCEVDPVVVEVLVAVPRLRPAGW